MLNQAINIVKSTYAYTYMSMYWYYNSSNTIYNISIYSINDQSGATALTFQLTVEFYNSGSSDICWYN